MFTVRRSAVAAASAAAVVFLCQNAARSQSFEVEPGQSAGPQTMTGAGDVGTVRAGGAVDGAGGDAVRMLDLGQRLRNDGWIGTSADGAAAVNAQGDSAAIFNDGSVVVTGNGSQGVALTGSGSYVENNGAISVFGDGTQGIIGAGSDLTVLNRGSIEVDGEAAAGIIWENDGLRVANSGSVVVSGKGSVGIGAGGNDVVIDNTGLVQATGQAAAGIFSAFGTAVIVNGGAVVVSGAEAGGIVAEGDGAAVTNRGSVRVSGDKVVGVGVASASATVANTGSIFSEGTDNVALSALGDGSTVTNSGRVISEQGVALYFGGSGATLNLLAGTAIQGPVVFSGNGDTATFGPGLNAVMTFSGAGVPERLLTGGRPFVVDGDTVAVVDPAGFASAGAVVQDLTGGIAGVVDARLSGPYDNRAEHLSRVWTSPFGVGRSQAASGEIAGYGEALGGLVAGAETNVGDDLLAGAFLGTAGGKTSVNGDAQDIAHRSLFAGGYLGYDTGTRFADASLSFGVLDEDSRRRVANNLVAGGVETARADYRGTFVSPSLTLGARMPYGAVALVPSLRLRYAGLFLDGYAETGAADGLSVARRDVHVFEARGQIALPMQPVPTPSGVLQATWRIGLDGTAQSGGDVAAKVLGQDIAFADGGRKGALRGFAGAGFSLSNRNGMRFQGDIETGYGSDRAFIVRAQAGLDVAF